MASQNNNNNQQNNQRNTQQTIGPIPIDSIEICLNFETVFDPDNNLRRREPPLMDVDDSDEVFVVVVDGEEDDDDEDFTIILNPEDAMPVDNSLNTPANSVVTSESTVTFSSANATSVVDDGAESRPSDAVPAANAAPTTTTTTTTNNRA